MNCAVQGVARRQASTWGWGNPLKDSSMSYPKFAPFTVAFRRDGKPKVFDAMVSLA